MPLAPPPGFEPIYTSSDSEPPPDRYIVKPSAGLTKPAGSQSGVKMEPQELISSPESDSDESGPEPESDSDGTDPKISEIAAMAKDSPKKRAADGKASEAKRRKKDPNQFKRLFCEEDEIAILKGMIRFAEMKSSSPLDDYDALLEFVKADLKAHPSTVQLKTKICKFRTKYIRNLRKEARGNARRLTAHERRAFEVSKIVWANEYIQNKKLLMSLKVADKKGKAKRNAKTGKAKINATAEVEAETTEIVCSPHDISVNMASIGAQLFEMGKGVEGEKEWHELKMAEMKVYQKKMKILCTQTSLVLDVLANQC